MMTEAPRIDLIYDHRQERYLRELNADADALGTELAMDRWRKTSTKAEIGEALALVQLIPSIHLTSVSLPHLIRLGYLYPEGVDEELVRNPAHAPQLLESLIPLLYHFGADHYRVLYQPDDYLHVCVYTRLHFADASERYDRFIDEWIQTDHPNWTTEIVWDLAVVRDDQPFKIVSR
jgi:hypothetical protein